jgi:DNA-binding LytR/AlgR family response regulator
LEQAFQRIVSNEKSSAGKIRFLAVKKRGGIDLIPLEDVLYIKGAGVYTELFLENGEKELHDKSLEKLEQLLSNSFERIHKSYLVKMTEANKIIISSGSKYELELTNGEVLPIGRTRYKEVKEKWF